LKETADFWVSRVVENQDGSYSILNVVGADEYAQHVDDNAFTNASAIESLKTLLKRLLF
jgi:trehalose/maltose hydrolase-like predicted phosphorylase